jgi:hypothetical protein
VNIYRLNPENRAQITKDNLGDISFELYHISPCISPEENGKNDTQNEQLRRLGSLISCFQDLSFQ